MLVPRNFPNVPQMKPHRHQPRIFIHSSHIHSSILRLFVHSSKPSVHSSKSFVHSSKNLSSIPPFIARTAFIYRHPGMGGILFISPPSLPFSLCSPPSPSSKARDALQEGSGERSGERSRERAKSRNPFKQRHSSASEGEISPFLILLAASRNFGRSKVPL